MSEEILRWCVERLATFKVPGMIEFVDELPRTSVGKIQKYLFASEASIYATLKAKKLFDALYLGCFFNSRFE